MAEKIEVRYQKIMQVQSGPMPFHHKYIIYTDNNGTEWIARGGPTNEDTPLNPGKLDTSWGKFSKDFGEWQNRDTDAREVIKSGSNLSSDWLGIVESIASFDSRYDYHILENNSNATVDTALRDAGLNEPILDNMRTAPFLNFKWSPGNKFITPPRDSDGDGIPDGDDPDDDNDGIPDERDGDYNPPDPKDFPDLTNPRRYDPLVLDLNGDGVKLTSVVGSKVKFDFGADGFKEQTGWVSAQDGLLVLDKNKNGKIDNGTELFGSATQDGFAALAAYDKDSKGKKDGKINASDVIFSQLRVWRDTKAFCAKVGTGFAEQNASKKNAGNGITDAGELLTLAQAGVKEISLTKKASGVDNAGNRVDYTGFFTRTNGKAGNAAANDNAVVMRYAA